MIPALVPAAGRSRRMGRPKLVLPLEGSTVISRLVSTLLAGGCDGVLVVAPPPGEEGAEALEEQARGAGADVLRLDEPTPDMRATVEAGLSALFSRRPDDLAGVLLAPGDSPGITPGLVADVLARFRSDPSRIVVPARPGRRGHPLVLPADLARAVPALPAGVGVNALLGMHEDRVVAIDVDEPGAFADLDTPEDYRRWERGAD